ncbi:hypothetical protein VCHENC02_3834A, partial [Vibrio harveyi]
MIFLSSKAFVDLLLFVVLSAKIFNLFRFSLLFLPFSYN